MSVSDRIYTYLEGQGGEADAASIAANALGLQGARSRVADQVVAAAVGDDVRVVRVAPNFWGVSKEPARSRLRACRYAVLVHVAGSDGRTAIAGVRTAFDGVEASTAHVLSDDDPEEAKHALETLRLLADGAVPAGFRWPGVGGHINRLARCYLGRRVTEEAGLCLFRLARRRFPDKSIPSLDAIADALGVPSVVERGPSDEAALAAELLIALLEANEADGLHDLEDVLQDQYPIREGVSFESFAFDGDDLSSLPQSPGVYVMRDRAGEVIYVGKSKHLHDRVRTYFSNQEDRPEKTRKILDRIWSVDVEVVGSELEALILEARLIRACDPVFNTQVDVHERPAGYARARSFVVIQPSVESDAVELFCVGDGVPIRQIRVRRDLTDWSTTSPELEACFFDGQGAGLEPEEEAAHHILQTWMMKHHETVDVIRVDDAAGWEDLCRLIGDAITDASGSGEKIWRV